MAKYTITQKSGSATYTLSTGARGPKGDAGASTAADVSFSPTGNIAATDVQAALAELDSEKAAVGDIPTVDNAAVVAAIAENPTATLGAANIGYLPQKYSTDISGVNYTAVEDGEAGGDITIAHVVSGTGSSVISVVVSGNAITVTAGSATTNSTVATQVNATPSAAALVTATAMDSDPRTAGFQTTLFTARTAENLTSPLSKIGRANKVLQYNAQGDIVTGDYDNNNKIAESGGNVFFPDKRGPIWLNTSGVPTKARIYMWEDHDSDGGELLIDSPHRICLSPGEKGALQFGLSYASTTMAFAYMQGRFTPTVSAPLGTSYPLFFNCGTYGVASADTTWPGIQGRGTASGDGELVFFAGSTFPNSTTNTDGTMPEVCAVTVDGLRDPKGNSPAFMQLDGTTNITIACSATKSSQNHYVTLTGNRTLEFSGLTAGMRGTIVVSQDSVGSRTLTLPSTSAKQTTLALSTAAYKVDILHWFYTGTDIFWEIANDFALPVDADAAAFLAAASITEASTEGVAINNLVKQLKADDTWGDFIEAWPLVGGASSSHAEGLKQNLTASFGAGVTHDANGISGSAANTKWMDTTANISALGLRDNIGFYCYNKTSTLTDSTHMFGTSGTNARFYVSKSSNRQYGNGPCSGTVNTGATVADVDNRGHYWFGRSSSTACAIAHKGNWTALTNTAVSAPTATMQFLSTNDGTGSATRGSSPSNANLAFCGVTYAITQAKYDLIRAAVDAFQTALGRQNV